MWMVCLIGKYGVRSPKFFGLHVHNCTHWLRPHNATPPPPRIWMMALLVTGSANTDDISL